MIYYAIITLIVIALCEMFKRLCVVPAKIIPALAVVFSICLCAAFFGWEPVQCIVTGCHVGGLAVGIFSSIKNIIEFILIAISRKNYY